MTAETSRDATRMETGPTATHLLSAQGLSHTHQGLSCPTGPGHAPIPPLFYPIAKVHAATCETQARPGQWLGHMLVHD